MNSKAPEVLDTRWRRWREGANNVNTGCGADSLGARAPRIHSRDIKLYLRNPTRPSCVREQMVRDINKWKSTSDIIRQCQLILH